MGATGSPRGAPRGRGSYAAVTQKLLAAGWIAAALLGLCASDATEEEHKSECELRAPETDVATGSGPALVHASYAYFEQANGYLPGCVLSDMDGAAGGGCVHYASLAEAVQRCDALTAAPRGCVPTDAAGQKNGCTCAGITKEGGGAKVTQRSLRRGTGRTGVTNACDHRSDSIASVWGLGRTAVC